MRWIACIAVGCGVVKAPSENSAPTGITTLHTAQVQYYSVYGRYAASLQELGPPANGADRPSAAGLIERDLANGEQRGYNYTLSATPTGYAISAAPTHYGASGSKTYFSDQGMGIHVHNGPEPATANDPTLGETAAP